MNCGRGHATRESEQACRFRARDRRPRAQFGRSSGAERRAVVAAPPIIAADPPTEKAKVKTCRTRASYKTRILGATTRRRSSLRPRRADRRPIVSGLTELARERGCRDVLIAADHFFAWLEQEPLVRVSPDIYLLDYLCKRPLPASWQTWLPGHRPPTLALEIVSDEGWAKDYRENPAKYAQLGARELIIFDPEAAPGRKGERVALQVFRREAQAFVRAYQGAGPAYCREIDAWFSVQREEEVANLGIARDAVASTEQALARERAA